MSIQSFSSNLENLRLFCPLDARNKINASSMTKVSKSLCFFACFSSYILLCVSDAYKGYLCFTGDSILSGFFKHLISLTGSGAARQIAISEKKGGYIEVTALQRFIKERRDEFIFGEKK